MKLTVALIAAGALVAGCKKNNSDNTKPSTTVTADMGSAAGSGAAAGSAAAKPMATEDLVKRYQDCWADWSAGKWDDLKGCYANDAVAESPGSGMPALNGAAAIVDMDKSQRSAFSDEKAQSQLVLASGKMAVAVALIDGKQSGALKTPAGELAATNKPVGFYMGQMVWFDDTGKVRQEKDFLDSATLVGQLKPQKDHPVRAVTEKLAMPEQVVIAKDDAKEKANLAAFQQVVDSFSKHDAKAFGALLADDTVWSEQPMPKDETKKELMTNVEQLWKGFSDLKLHVQDSFAAGDYVAATETFEGTNDGDVPAMHVKKTGKKVSVPFLAIHEIDGGKVKKTWIFFDGNGFASQLGLAPDAKANKLTKK